MTFSNPGCTEEPYFTSLSANHENKLLSTYLLSCIVWGFKKISIFHSSTFIFRKINKNQFLLCLFRWLAWTLDACLELSRIIGTLMLACHWNA